MSGIGGERTSGMSGGSTQILLRGHVLLYDASTPIVAALHAFGGTA